MSWAPRVGVNPGTNKGWKRDTKRESTLGWVGTRSYLLGVSVCTRRPNGGGGGGEWEEVPTRFSIVDRRSASTRRRRHQGGRPYRRTTRTNGHSTTNRDDESRALYRGCHRHRAAHGHRCRKQSGDGGGKRNDEGAFFLFLHYPILRILIQYKILLVVDYAVRHKYI